MRFRHSVKFENSLGRPLRVLIEPWAVEFELPNEETCEVVATSDIKQPHVNCEAAQYGIIFWVEGEGAVYEYWQNGKLVD